MIRPRTLDGQILLSPLPPFSVALIGSPSCEDIA